MAEVDSQLPVGEQFVANFQLASPDSIDTERQLVFGWASVANDKEGTPVVDAYGHIIEPEELEDAVYMFVKCGGMMAGVEHEYMYAGTIVESMVFTKEKMAKMGIPAGTLPEAWWIGIYVYDKALFEMVKAGMFKMLSIKGRALATEIVE